jgi:hypothetical protein
MPSSKLPFSIGVPQLAALALLGVFLAQCLWFIARVPITSLEASFIEDGLVQLDNMANAGSAERSPLVPLLAAVPIKLVGSAVTFSTIDDYRLLIRLPFVLAGLLLGASLWYVARRLYGNMGGFIALALYGFSPLIITRSSTVQEDILGAWGGFGMIFTAIAVAHTLYAPREVVFWNWRRILLLGISIAVCIGAQFSLWILLLPAFAFLLWVGHVRRPAAVLIFVAALVIALALLFGFYEFRPVTFAHALRDAQWFEFSPRQFASKVTYQLVGQFFLQAQLGLVVLMVGAIGVFAAWKHTRFFGNAAPLITAVALVVAATGTEHFSAGLLLFVSLPFLILFAAGVAVDLLESRYAVFANAVIIGALIANAMLDIYGLMELRRATVR